MSRKKLIYAKRKPFYLSAQSLHKNWSEIPLEEVWDAFSERFDELNARENLKLKIHGFVITQNRYHLIATAASIHDLQHIASRIQGGTSLRLNACLQQVFYAFKEEVDFKVIEDRAEFKNFLKYVYRAPVELGLSSGVQDYRFSTLNKESEIKQINRYKKFYTVGDAEGPKFIKWLEDKDDPDWTQFKISNYIGSKIKVRTY